MRREERCAGGIALPALPKEGHKPLPPNDHAPAHGKIFVHIYVEPKNDHS